MAREAGFGQKSRLPWPKAGFFLARSRLTPAYSRLCTGQSRLTPANAGLVLGNTLIQSRLTPANAGFFWPKPASVLAKEEAGFGQKPALSGQSRLLSGQKEPAFGQKSRLLWPKGAGSAGFRRLPVSFGRHRKEPAKAGEAGSFFGQERAGLHRPEKPASFGQERAGLSRLRRLPSVAQGLLSPARVRHLLASTSEATRLLNDVIFEGLFDARGGKCGKHSYSAQRNTEAGESRLFLGFPGCVKAGFGESRLEPTSGAA